MEHLNKRKIIFAFSNQLNQNERLLLYLLSLRKIERLGVNCIIVLRAAFTHSDFKSATKTDNLTVFFALLGSAHIKASRRMVKKLTPAR
jgi:hypothetical protein